MQTLEPVRLVVTGSRAFEDGALVAELLTRVLVEVAPTGRTLFVADGGARGVDAFARAWRERAQAMGLAVDGRTYAADWRSYGLWAGPRRNREMLDAVKPHLVFAFAGHRGTYDCTVAAVKRGIPVARVPELTLVRPKEIVLCPKC